MPVEIKREGNACEKCKKSSSEVGQITHYKKHGDDLLLCPKCLEFREKPYKEICPVCKELAYKKGGMSFYGHYPDNYEDMCVECVEKKEATEAKRKTRNLRIKKFIIENWKFWIGTTIAIIIGIFGVIHIR